jgi:RNA polymerase sigma-70 factor (ECF subfamily)
MTDDALITSFNNGDQSAFTQLVDRYKRDIFNYMFTRTSDRELSSDLSQEVFVRIYQNARRYQAKGKFRAWLFQIARNIYIDAVRKDSKASVISIDEKDLYDIEDPSETPSHRYEIKEMSDLVSAVLAGLPDQQRTAFELCQFHGKRYHEIASIMHCPVGTVKSRIHSALSKIRDAFVENDIL